MGMNMSDRLYPALGAWQRRYAEEGQHRFDDLARLAERGLAAVE